MSEDNDSFITGNNIDHNKFYKHKSRLGHLVSAVLRLMAFSWPQDARCRQKTCLLVRRPSPSELLRRYLLYSTIRPCWAEDNASASATSTSSGGETLAFSSPSCSVEGVMSLAAFSLAGQTFSVPPNLGPVFRGQTWVLGEHVSVQSPAAAWLSARV